MVPMEDQDAINSNRRKMIFHAILNKRMKNADFDFYMKLSDDEFLKYKKDPKKRLNENKLLDEKKKKKSKLAHSGTIDDDKVKNKSEDESSEHLAPTNKPEELEKKTSNEEVEVIPKQQKDEKRKPGDLKPKTNKSKKAKSSGKKTAEAKESTTEPKDIVQEIKTQEFFIFTEVQLINRYKIVFPNNTYMTNLLAKNATLITFLKNMIYNRIVEHLYAPSRSNEYDRNKIKLKDNINFVIEKYSCYFLVDSVNNGEYYANDDIQCMEPATTSDHIVSCMVLEKNVDVTENYCVKNKTVIVDGQRSESWSEKTRNKDACIIHFICTKSGLENKNYGRRLLKTVFSDNKELLKKTVYGVSRTQYMKKGE